MNIKRFQAKDISSALAMVKAEFGDDAVILKTSKKRGRDPLTGNIRNFVEITAAIDFDLVDEQEKKSPVIKAKRPAGKVCNLNGSKEDKTLNRVHSNSEDSLCKKDQERPSTSSDASGSTATEESRDLGHMTEDLPLFGSPLLTLHNVFSTLGIDPVLQHELASRFLSCFKGTNTLTHSMLLSWLEKFVSKGITVANNRNFSAPIWWAFIGPTGVGKTTSIAKIAARLRFQHGLRGVLATIDTYKLGGTEQIAKYSELMGIDLEIAKNSQELMKIFSQHREKDFILVDTTGRSIYDPDHEEELTRIFAAVPGLKAQALLCANSKPEDLSDLARFYSKYPVEGWIISKLDETRSTGSLWTPIFRHRLPISFITNGQKVPEDIKPASPELLTQILLQSKHNLQKENKSSTVFNHKKTSFNNGYIPVEEYI